MPTLKIDKSIQDLAGYVASVSYEDLTPEVVLAVKNRIVDTMGCGISAFNVEAAQIARQLAVPFDSVPSARIIGSLVRTTPECAAFANVLMCRYADFNDDYQWLGGGHVSDVISGILAAGEAFHANGKEFITSIAIAYDVFCYFIEQLQIRDRGWDHSIYVTLGTAIGAGKLLGLNREQLCHCISLALVANICLDQARREEISMWKAGAAGNASRQGLFSVFLARAGMTGPPGAIEGMNGFWNRVSGPFNFDSLVQKNKASRILRTTIKQWPVRGGAQLPVATALQLREKLSGEGIRELRIEAYNRTIKYNQDPDQWAPKSKETADHSLPFCVASAIIDGEITSSTFSSERLADPTILRLMGRMRVEENPQFTKEFPSAQNCRMTATTESGKTVSVLLKWAEGERDKQRTTQSIEAKFNRLTEDFLTAEQRNGFINSAHALDSLSDVASILENLKISQHKFSV